MLNQKLTVSRKQGVVQCLADGTATLTSEGRGPTLWREHGGMSRARHTRGFRVRVGVRVRVRVRAMSRARHTRGWG
eukprot:scaffold71222_cov50-Phaeocystis_antarctica.AAC.1